MIRSNAATTNQNGAGSIIIGLASTENERLRGLFEFDISMISAAAQIDSVTFALTTLTANGSFEVYIKCIDKPVIRVFSELEFESAD